MISELHELSAGYDNTIIATDRRLFIPNKYVNDQFVGHRINEEHRMAVWDLR